MAISWIAALKLVPWGDVIEAAPHVLKAAKGLLRRSDGDGKAEPKPVSPTPQVDLSRDDAAAQALAQVAMLQERITQLEQMQRESVLLIEQMAEQQSQIVQTVGLLRTGATRLAWACGGLAVCVVGLLVYVGRNA